MFSRESIRARVPVTLSFSGLGRTKQAHKDECDVNKIVKRFEKTGVLAHVTAKQASYGDFSPIDYREAIEVVMKAEEAFSQLPASVRRRFDNDPAAFLEAAENPAFRDEFEALGLLEKPVAVDPKGIDGGGLQASPEGAPGAA